jgi:DNA-binding protein HU-beta
MTKAELISAVAKKADLTKAESGKVIDAIVESITEALKKGNKISLLVLKHSLS